jgi:hypothetical protein
VIVVSGSARAEPAMCDGRAVVLGWLGSPGQAGCYSLSVCYYSGYTQLLRRNVAGRWQRWRE